MKSRAPVRDQVFPKKKMLKLVACLFALLTVASAQQRCGEFSLFDLSPPPANILAFSFLLSLLQSLQA